SHLNDTFPARSIQHTTHGRAGNAFHARNRFLVHAQFVVHARDPDQPVQLHVSHPPPICTNVQTVWSLLQSTERIRRPRPISSPQRARAPPPHGRRSPSG